MSATLEDFKGLLDSTDRREFEPDELKLFVYLSNAGSALIETIHTDLLKENQGLYLALFKRLAGHGWESRIERRVAIFTACLCSNPAEAVLWAYSLVRLASTRADQRVTWMDFVHAFPHGVPTKEAYRKIWYRQPESLSTSSRSTNSLDTCPWPKPPLS